MSRVFITLDEAKKMTGRDNEIMLLEVNAVNSFLDNYLTLDEELLSKYDSVVKLSAIRMLNFWNRNDPSLSEIKDVDVTIKYDTKVNKTIIPIDVVQLLIPVKRIDEVIINNSGGFSFF